MPETSESIRSSLLLKGWFTLEDKNVAEGTQQKSYWYHNDPAKIDIHLQLVEEITDTGTEPKLFMYDYETGWRQLTIADVT